MKLAHSENVTVIEKPECAELPPKEIIAAAYRYCQTITTQHYENFPVASWLLPKQFRKPITAIYAFSRLADDFADEACYQGMRLQKLKEWQNLLLDPTMPTHPVFIALKDAGQRFNIPNNLLLDLLSAFEQDVQKKRYENFTEVLDYCRRSANPVGRLVLVLHGHHDPEWHRWSDHICTALQLTNFWQDIAVDLKKDRIYLPQDDLEKYGVSEQDLFAAKTDDCFKRLMCFQVERTQEIFEQGKELGSRLHGALGIEIRLTWLTGMTILQKIKEVHYNVFSKRPTLTKWDFIKLLPIALRAKTYEQYRF